MIPQPGTLDNIEPSIYCPSSPGYDDVSIKKKPDYKGSFKSLSEEGLKIKNYKVTDGAGRPICED